MNTARGTISWSHSRNSIKFEVDDEGITMQVEICLFYDVTVNHHVTTTLTSALLTCHAIFAQNAFQATMETSIRAIFRKSIYVDYVCMRTTRHFFPKYAQDAAASFQTCICAQESGNLSTLTLNKSLITPGHK